MTQLEAIYENGVFRPLRPVRLAEHQHVTIAVEEEETTTADQVHFVLAPDRWQAFCDALDAPPKDIPALRQLLTEPSLFDGINDAAS
jgi:hypothetical protein